MLNLGSASLQQFNKIDLYGKRFSFKEFDKIICYDALLQTIQFCKSTYSRFTNLQFVNKAVSNYNGSTVYKFQQNESQKRSFNTINMYTQVVGSAGTIQKGNITPKILGNRIQTRTVEVIDIEDVLLTHNINQKDYNVLKIDIQGSQYPVFQKLLVSGNLKLFKQIYAEFHSQLFANEPKVIQIERNVMKYCQINGLILEIQQ